jgi:hypothetical protein
MCISTASSSLGHFGSTAEERQKLPWYPLVSYDFLGVLHTIIYVKLNLCCLFTNNKCEAMNYFPTYLSKDVTLKAVCLDNSSCMHGSDKHIARQV